MGKIVSIVKVSQEEFRQKAVNGRFEHVVSFGEFGEGSVVRISKKIPRKHKGGRIVYQSLFDKPGWNEMVEGVQDTVVSEEIYGKYQVEGLPTMHFYEKFIVVDGILYKNCSIDKVYSKADTIKNLTWHA